MNAYNNQPTAVCPSEPLRAKLPQIPSALEAQDNLLGGLHGLLTDLEHRLQPVMSPEPPTPCVAKDSAPPQNVVENILAHSRSIEAASARLASMRDRLHV